MTLTASAGIKANEDVNLIGDIDVMPASKQQSNLVETTTENTQDLTSVLGKVFKKVMYLL